VFKDFFLQFYTRPNSASAGTVGTLGNCWKNIPAAQSSRLPRITEGLLHKSAAIWQLTQSQQEQEQDWNVEDALHIQQLLAGHR